jgi:hypothetical protein
VCLSNVETSRRSVTRQYNDLSPDSLPSLPCASPPPTTCP